MQVLTSNGNDNLYDFLYIYRKNEFNQLMKKSTIREKMKMFYFLHTEDTKHFS